MADAGLKYVETYVSRCQNTVARFIATRPIMDLCLAEEQRPDPRVSKRWCEQDGVDVERMWTAAWEAKRTGGGVDGQDRDRDRLSSW